MNLTYLEWNKQGIIPGPSESEEEFSKRAQYCLRLREELFSLVGTELPFDVSDQASEAILEKAVTKTRELYGIAPKWVPLFFSNYQLSLWQGGCAWIFQLDEKTPTAAFLQLRSQFRLKEKYLGIYEREELISHELSHVGRMMYQEPQFEEILAYQSSTGWRRWLGPIVQSSKESLFFILLLGFIILADLALISLGNDSAYRLFVWIKLIPITIIILALARLAWRHYRFNKAKRNLEALFSSEASDILYRLTDQEINLFAKSDPQGVHAYIEQQDSFRWKVIQAGVKGV